MFDGMVNEMNRQDIDASENSDFTVGWKSMRKTKIIIWYTIRLKWTMVWLCLNTLQSS